MFTLLVALYISVPALIGVMLFAISWMLKYKPEMIFEFQDLFIIGGVAGGIILIMPLLITIVILMINLWKKISKYKK